MPRFLLHPLDTLFFRDGRPFEQDDEGMADVRSLFPPFPGVLGGAVRAALARQQGWDGTGNWKGEPAVLAGQPTTLDAVLGDGADPGKLTLGPPAVLQLHDGRWRRLYPAPQHLLSGKTPQGSALVFVAPSPRQRALRCDLDAAVEVRLPELPRRPDESRIEGAKPLSGRWLTPAGMADVLDARCPAPVDIVDAGHLWQHEFRVGLQRDSVSRTAVPGMLYAGSQVRLRDGVALGLEVGGLDAGWIPQSPTFLGGAQRLAEIECATWEQAVHHPMASEAIRFVAILTGPMKPHEHATGWRMPGAILDPLLPDATVVAACLDRPMMIGGWDGAQRRPRRLQPCLPAGTVFFLERTGPSTPWPAALGQNTKAGYGSYLAGLWPDGGAP